MFRFRSVVLLLTAVATASFGYVPPVVAAPAGFDRTMAISTLSSEQIAQAAQQFGQEDDITVLTLTFSPAPNLVEAIHA